MHKFFAFVLILFSILQSEFSFAEENKAKIETEKDPVHWSRERVVDELTSPWTTKARTYLLAGTGAVLTLLAFQDDLVYDTQKSISTRKPLKHYSIYGDYGGQLIPNILYAGGMYWAGKNDNAMLMVKSTLYSGTVATAMKFIVNEERPNGSNRHSFPSGHSTTAFAFASTVASLHEWYYGAAAYAFASFVGFSRINDNMHYLHDVVAGATLGMVYGIGVAELSKKFVYARNKKKELKKLQSELHITPIVDPQLLGVFARYEF